MAGHRTWVGFGLRSFQNFSLDLFFFQPHLKTMPSALKLEAESIMASDGLRYTFKGGGSPFQDSANMGTMSCYRCGLHKPRALGTFTRFLNQRTFICQECAAKFTKRHN
ncbi:hypothetical protein B9Z50_15035 [Limnohabitans sp. Bal53]|nr:hypothetical protein B9Z50_15035 [Limnohabitans sp. Bal53]